MEIGSHFTRTLKFVLSSLSSVLLSLRLKYVSSVFLARPLILCISPESTEQWMFPGPSPHICICLCHYSSPISEHFFGASSCSKTIQTSPSWPAQFCTCTWVLANINTNFQPSLIILNAVGMLHLQQHHVRYFPKRFFCYKKAFSLLLPATAANHPLTMIVLSLLYPILLVTTVLIPG